MKKSLFKYILVMIVGLLLGLAINIPSCKGPDTLTILVPVHDTIIIDSVRILNKINLVYIDRIDTFYLIELDTVYLYNLPIDYLTYKDTIRTDSTSTEIEIEYHGFSSGIDNILLTNNYYNKKEIILMEPKRISPFIYMEAGPRMGPNNYIGAQIGIGGGILFKDSWGIGGSIDWDTYNLYTIKGLVYKKF